MDYEFELCPIQSITSLSKKAFCSLVILPIETELGGMNFTFYRNLSKSYFLLKALPEITRPALCNFALILVSSK